MQDRKDWNNHLKKKENRAKVAKPEVIAKLNKARYRWLCKFRLVRKSQCAKLRALKN